MGIGTLRLGTMRLGKSRSNHFFLIVFFIHYIESAVRFYPVTDSVEIDTGMTEKSAKKYSHKQRNKITSIQAKVTLL